MAVPVQTKFTGDVGPLISSIKRASGEMDRFASDANQKLGAIKMPALSTAAITAAATAVTGFGFTATKVFGDVDRQLRQVVKLFPDRSKEAQEEMRSLFEDFSSKLGLSMNQVLDAGYKAASLGHSNLFKAREILTVAGDLFLAGGGELQRHIELLDVYSRSFDEPLRKIADLITQTEALGNTTAAMVSQFAGRLGQPFADAKIEAEEFFAMITALTISGFDTSRATSYLDALRGALLNSTAGPAKAIIQEAGLPSWLDYGGIEGNTVVGYLQTAEERLGRDRYQTIWATNREAGAAASILSLPRQSDLLRQFDNVYGLSERDAAFVGENAARDLESIRQNMQILVQNFGQGFAGGLGGTLGLAGDFLGSDALRDLAQRLGETASIFVTLLRPLGDLTAAVVGLTSTIAGFEIPGTGLSTLDLGLYGALGYGAYRFAQYRASNWGDPFMTFGIRGAQRPDRGSGFSEGPDWIAGPDGMVPGPGNVKGPNYQRPGAGEFHIYGNSYNIPTYRGNSERWAYGRDSIHLARLSKDIMLDETMLRIQQQRAIAGLQMEAPRVRPPTWPRMPDDYYDFLDHQNWNWAYGAPTGRARSYSEYPNWRVAQPFPTYALTGRFPYGYLNPGASGIPGPRGGGGGGLTGYSPVGPASQYLGPMEQAALTGISALASGNLRTITQAELGYGELMKAVRVKSGNLHPRMVVGTEFFNDQGLTNMLRDARAEAEVWGKNIPDRMTGELFEYETLAQMLPGGPATWIGTGRAMQRGTYRGTTDPISLFRGVSPGIMTDFYTRPPFMTPDASIAKNYGEIVKFNMPALPGPTDVYADFLRTTMGPPSMRAIIGAGGIAANALDSTLLDQIGAEATGELYRQAFNFQGNPAELFKRFGLDLNVLAKQVAQRAIMEVNYALQANPLVQALMFGPDIGNPAPGWHGDARLATSRVISDMGVIGNNRLSYFPAQLRMGIGGKYPFMEMNPIPYGLVNALKPIDRLQSHLFNSQLLAGYAQGLQPYNLMEILPGDRNYESTAGLLHELVRDFGDDGSGEAMSNLVWRMISNPEKDGGPIPFNYVFSPAGLQTMAQGGILRELGGGRYAWNRMQYEPLPGAVPRPRQLALPPGRYNESGRLNLEGFTRTRWSAGRRQFGFNRFEGVGPGTAAYNFYHGRFTDSETRRTFWNRARAEYQGYSAQGQAEYDRAYRQSFGQRPWQTRADQFFRGFLPFGRVNDPIWKGWNATGYTDPGGSFHSLNRGELLRGAARRGISAASVGFLPVMLGTSVLGQLGQAHPDNIGLQNINQTAGLAATLGILGMGIGSAIAPGLGTVAGATIGSALGAQAANPGWFSQGAGGIGFGASTAVNYSVEPVVRALTLGLVDSIPDLPDFGSFWRPPSGQPPAARGTQTTIGRIMSAATAAAVAPWVGGFDLDTEGNPYFKNAGIQRTLDKWSGQGKLIGTGSTEWDLLATRLAQDPKSKDFRNLVGNFNRDAADGTINDPFNKDILDELINALIDNTAANDDNTQATQEQVLEAINNPQPAGIYNVNFERIER